MNLLILVMGLVRLQCIHIQYKCTTSVSAPNQQHIKPQVQQSVLNAGDTGFVEQVSHLMDGNGTHASEGSEDLQYVGLTKMKSSEEAVSTI